MIIIAPVKTGNSNKSLWFDASDFVDADIANGNNGSNNSNKKPDKDLEKEVLATAEIKSGDKVVVNTARGQEFGTVTGQLFVATEKQIKNLKSELKPVRRKAKDVDFARRKEMKKRGLEVLPTFKELAAELNPQMNPIDVEYLLDGRKAIFYFSAPERQDFRELVKRLSNELHIRIDMHQINERDKAKIVSGLGICGQELCCARTGKCPKHVSIKMAKAQGLSLNPENISGCCGKLMCCLNYEYDLYEEFVKRAPKLKAKIETPEGTATVTDVNMPNETVQIKYGDPEKRLRLPLSSLVAIRRKGQDKSQNVRPNTIKPREWEAALNEDSYLGAGILSSVGGSSSSKEDFENINFSGDEKLSDGKVRQMPTRRRRSTTLASGSDADGQKQSNGHSDGHGDGHGNGHGDGHGSGHGNGHGRSSNQRGHNSKIKNRRNKNRRSNQNNQRNRSNQNNQRNRNNQRNKNRNSSNNRRDVYKSDSTQTRQRRSRTISSKPTARPGQHSSGLRKD